VNMFRRKPRVLTQLAISEVSAVDKAAAPGARIVLLKRDAADRAVLKAKFDEAARRLARSVKSILNDDDVTDKNAWLSKSFVQCLDHLNSLTGTRTPLNDAVALHRIFGIAKNDSERSEPDLSDSDAGMPDRRRRRRRDDEAARLASQMDTDADHDRDDDEEQRKEKNNMQTRGQEMRKLAGLSPLQLCKRISADNDAYDLTEEQVHSVVQCVAKQYARPGESEGSAFLRLLSGRDEIANACNAALAVAKNASRPGGFSTAANIATRAALRKGGTLMPLEPLVSGGAAAMDVNSDDSEPYQQLMAIARRMHDASPELTLEQCFDRTFSSPEYRALANKERAQAHARSMALGGGMVPI
jgi:hypothetical protein